MEYTNNKTIHLFIKLMLVIMFALFIPTQAMALDTDGDSIDNTIDIDDDNDGILDSFECSSPLVDWNQLTETATQISGTLNGVGVTVTTTSPHSLPLQIKTDEFITIGDGGLNALGADFSTSERLEIVHTSQTGGAGLEETIFTFTQALTEPMYLHIAGFDYSYTISNTMIETLINGTGIGTDTFTAIPLPGTTPHEGGTSTLIPAGTIEVKITSLEAANDRYYVNLSQNTLPDCDLDNDGIDNHLDLDSDNDGIPDNIEAQTTQGYILPSGVDADNDGLDDAYDANTSGETNSTGVTPVNTDSNDTVDYLDLDSDNDGIFDIVESGQGLNADVNGSTTDPVGVNGLANTVSENADDYNDTNGKAHDGGIFTLDDTDNDTADDGSDASPMTTDLDYRDNAVLVLVIDAVDDFNTSVTGVGGVAIADVTVNDTLDTNSTLLGTDVNITSVTNTTPLIIDTLSGTVTVPPSTPAGTYIEMYTLCEIANPSNCDDANIIVTVLEDTDADGIPDYIDIDDDNDGILDKEERVRNIINQYANNDVSPSLEIDDNYNPDYGVVYDLDVNRDYTFTDVLGAEHNYTETITHTDFVNALVYNSTDNGVLQLYSHVYQGLSGSPLPLGSEESYTLDFTSLIPKRLGFILGDLDNHEALRLVGYRNGVAITPLVSTYFINGEIIYDVVETQKLLTLPSGAIEIISDGTATGSPNHVYTFIQFMEPIDQLVVTGFQTSLVGSSLGGSTEIYRMYDYYTDSDNDGLEDYLDLDSDNDGIPDNIEAQTTQGYILPSGVDADNDGLDDAYDANTSGETNSTGVTPVNTDNNDTVDYLDLDSDNDGIFDIVESGQGLNADVNGSTTDPVGVNGLANTVSENADDYNDTNGKAYDGGIFTLDDTDDDTADDGSDASPMTTDLDYRDNSVLVLVIDAIDDNATGQVGEVIANVTNNDTLDGDPVILGDDVNITEVNNTTPLVVDPATGSVTIPTGTTPAGEYTFNYTICENLNPNNCDEANVTVTVTAIAPDFKPVLTVYGGIVYGAGVHDFSFDTLVLNVIPGSTYDANNPLIIRIPKNEALILSYDSTMTLFKGDDVENNLWSFDDTNAFDYVMTYLGTDIPTNRSRFAITGTFTVEEGEVGRFILETTIKSGTGGDSNIDNNSDRDTMQKKL
ncbi:MAG: internalin, putative [uncultured Sulfurovum sp.]|uniref:Internalin, putative n=1 Tax=uncultured Sulfurovum sp. TaxID=269237 RepID=A0A6S6SPY6_9BACT|nr:MAG: internalin, putative [uncultured Sulfurovum sp.]